MVVFCACVFMLTETVPLLLDMKMMSFIHNIPLAQGRLVIS